MDMEKVKSRLENATLNFSDRNLEAYELFLKKQKAAFVLGNDQEGAKRVWIFEEILKIQSYFINAYYLMLESEYFDAWCLLDRADILLGHLADHFSETGDTYRLKFIKRKIPEYQALFPYKFGMSPEYLIKEKRCGICDSVMTYESNCGHEVGEIYNGEMCYRKITDMDILGTSFVDKPRQKYSILFPVDPKHPEKKDLYNYSVLKYLVTRLASPFHDWKATWTKTRHPHNLYSFVGRNEKCPCDSGLKYKKCCLLEEGVLRPHCEFGFEVTPAPEMLKIEYS